MKNIIALLFCFILPISVFAQSDWDETDTPWDDGTEVTVPMDQEIKQTINLEAGCNWISIYIKDGLKVSEITQTGIGRIQDQHDETVFDTKLGRTGTLEKLIPGYGYKIYANKAMTIEIEGFWCKPALSSLSLIKGWNWIGVPYLKDRPLAMVFVNPSPGDVITTQESSAVYNGTEWSGTLTTIRSGASYNYKSINNKTLIFKYQ